MTDESTKPWNSSVQIEHVALFSHCGALFDADVETTVLAVIIGDKKTW